MDEWTNPYSANAIEAAVNALPGVRECVLIDQPATREFAVVCLGGDPSAILDAIESRRMAGVRCDLTVWASASMPAAGMGIAHGWAIARRCGLGHRHG